MNSCWPRFEAVLLSQAAGVQPMQVVVLAALAVMALAMLGTLFVFVRLFRLWLKAILSGANIPVAALIGMMLRRTPMDDVVRWTIMAAQAGVPVTSAQIESAILQGVDTERAVLAMIRARQTGMSITWEEVIAEDADQRLRQKLYGE